MATSVDVDNQLNSQDGSKQMLLNDSQLDAKTESLEPTTNEDQTAISKSNDRIPADTWENKRNPQVGQDGRGDICQEMEIIKGTDLRVQNVESSKSEAGTSSLRTDHTTDISDSQKDEQPAKPESPTTEAASSNVVQNDGSTAGGSTPVLDDNSAPPTPRSTAAKPSVFKKSTGIQKVNLNKDFLKNLLPASAGSQPISTTPRAAISEKPKAPSSVTKALKPMVRNRLSNMGGTSMQRQGSGSSTSKSGRGNSPNFGRAGSGSEVWSWRRQPTAQREYSEEELQRQGVHLTARLTSGADGANKWADMDDDWSDEEVVEEPKEISELPAALQENHIDDPRMPLAPHLLESAALSHLSEKHEEAVIVTKNERFADVTFDRRDTRSPDDNIHGQRQIYNAKLGRFEEVPSSSGRDRDQRGRKNVEIMQRGQAPKGSSVGRRRDSLAKAEEARQSKGAQAESRGYPPSTQRRTSFAEREPSGVYQQRRRDSFISNSAVSDADRSVSNSSPAVETHASDQLSPIDLIALQQKEMAESRKRALERRAKDEEERAAAAERARKKAAELAAAAAAAKSSAEAASTRSETPQASPGPSTESPIPQKASPVLPKASPLPQKESNNLSKPPHIPSKISPNIPVVLPSSVSEDTGAKLSIPRRDSEVWRATRDLGEIIRKESPSKEEGVPKRSAWGAIGSSQTSTPHKHQQNGLFGNPNTLATINQTIGGDVVRRGRNQTRPPRAPITPTNVPPPLQGWANFASNLETRKAHDEEKQQERNKERERIEKERGTNPQKPSNLFDKWRKIEIKEPENAGDVAGRTVVSVLKSGYSEDLSGNLEVKETHASGQTDHSDTSGTTSGISNVLSQGSPSPTTAAESPALGSSGQAIGIQTSTQPTQTPSSRSRSRFFPNPVSTVVDMSPRIVHSVQPSHPDKSLFPQGLFSSFEDLGKSPPSSAVSQLPNTSASFGNQQGPQRHHPPFGQYGQVGTMSPGQTIASATHVGGLTPRSAFSHTVPVASPSLPPSTKPKLPSIEDYDLVLERLRQTIDASHKEASQNEDITPFTTLNTIDEQIQTRTDATPVDSGTSNTYLKISAVSPHRDLEISTRDLDEEPMTKSTVKVSLPKILYISSRDMEVPVDTTPPPRINLPTRVPSYTDTADAKSRIIAMDNELSQQSSQRPPNNGRPPQAFKIQFAPSLRPKGGVVPNLVKRDKHGAPYVNFEATPEALTLPCYANDNEVFYAHRERPSLKHPKQHPKPHNRNPGPYRRPPKAASEGNSSSHSEKAIAGPSRPVEKS